MPVSRRKRRDHRPDLETLTRHQERELLFGRPVFPEMGFGDIETLAAAWALHRQRLLPAWIADRPGTRPFAWWLLEAVPKFGERLKTTLWQEQYREASTGPYGMLHTHFYPSLQESESAYLVRNGLLTAKEKKLHASGELDLEATPYDL